MSFLFSLEAYEPFSDTYASVHGPVGAGIAWVCGYLLVGCPQIRKEQKANRCETAMGYRSSPRITPRLPASWAGVSIHR